MLFPLKKHDKKLSTFSFNLGKKNVKENHFYALVSHSSRPCFVIAIE